MFLCQDWGFFSIKVFHYLNSQSKVSTDVWKGLEITQKFKKYQMKKTLIWGMQEKTK